MYIIQNPDLFLSIYTLSFIQKKLFIVIKQKRFKWELYVFNSKIKIQAGTERFVRSSIGANRKKKTFEFFLNYLNSPATYIRGAWYTK